MKIDLNGNWQMKDVKSNQWIETIVPGDMYNDLLVNEVIEDPFYRENEYDALELSKHDYEYERDFQVNKEIFNCDQVYLTCHGLDTLCTITVNDELVGKTDNMHRLYEWDIKRILKEGMNKIHLYFASPIKYVEEKHAQKPLCKGKDSLQGIYYLRKGHSMFGWDWGPKLPDVGIWRDITIDGYMSERIEQVYITQTHEEESVLLAIKVNRTLYSSHDTTLEVRVIDPDGNVMTKEVKGESEEQTVNMVIDHPQLWWPNGYGNQPLYRVEVNSIIDDKVVSTNTNRIGLRTVIVRQEADQWGESFEVVVNGVALFLMGADYIPEDNLLARCNPARTEQLLKGCIKANFNCVRVWGGGHYPETYFYDLCDEMGLLVWQDFMFACRLYDLTDEFVANIEQEFVDNIRRIRHHACLALWCGNNEIEWGLSDNWLPDTPQNRSDYVRQYAEIIPNVLRKEDPNTFYWPSSPSAKGDFNDPNCDHTGDMHYWGVWHETKPFTDYRKYFPRFMSEFGLQSFPGIKTIKDVTIEEDRNIFSPVMENHQKNSSCNAKILHYIAETFRYPKDFESLLDVSQLIQAEGIKYGVEHWRRNRGRCMGAIYWQLNDCWPVASWASIDYYGRWKALHYAAKRFYSPLLISACEDGTMVELHVTNETLNNVKGVVHWKLRKITGEVIEKDILETTVASLSSKQCITLEFKDVLTTNELLRNHYLEYAFITEEGIMSSGTVLFVKPKHLALKDPQIETVVKEERDYFEIQLEVKTFAKFVRLDFKNIDGIFDDNFFDLSPETIKIVKVLKEDLIDSVTGEVFKNELMITSLEDTFE